MQESWLSLRRRLSGWKFLFEVLLLFSEALLFWQEVLCICCGWVPARANKITVIGIPAKQDLNHSSGFVTPSSSVELKQGFIVITDLSMSLRFWKMLLYKYII